MCGLWKVLWVLQQESPRLPFLISLTLIRVSMCTFSIPPNRDLLRPCSLHKPWWGPNPRPLVAANSQTASLTRTLQLLLLRPLCSCLAQLPTCSFLGPPCRPARS
ncbi:hypothetical protein BT67DRAFT_188293 [Trichocladium antarcticum]|uniref:Uncharacterized protein n=1 Tax=Trichocladium antarcticum TaxID=1450529 RepID=A0AAN6UPS0_9PEZI|nr:hypothetical protein BT67DRAFT_188293 [Trichocladium antarcticum]